MSQAAIEEEELYPSERWWVDHYEWLNSCGYKLRPRYAPDWVPSWKGTKKESWNTEDGIPSIKSAIMDATRKKDGAFVTLKRVECDIHPYEKDIIDLFQSDDLASDPKNHCVRVLEFLEVKESNDIIIVMPLLRDFDSPKFETVGELIGCLQQLFEGLQFIHKQNIAHRDCNERNAMMDGQSLYIDPWHPKLPNRQRDNRVKNARHYSRTQRPPAYYWIDFGISRRYDDDVTSPLEDVIKGGDISVPEHQNITGPLNPFPTDVYYLGNLVLQKFLETYEGLEFLRGLIEDMVQEDPNKRPTMNEAVDHYEKLCQNLNTSQLRAALVYRDSTRKDRLWLLVTQWSKRILYVISRTPPIPTPPSRAS